MNKRLLITCSILVAFLVGFGIFLVQLFPANTPTVTKKSSSQPMQQPAQSTTTTSTNEMPAGVYQPYSETAFATTQENRRILFFHASWCQQCQKLDKAISANSLPSDVVIFKVDYDSSTALRAKYGITLQTTFVEVDPAGGKVNSVVAYNEPTYATVAKSFGFQQAP